MCIYVQQVWFTQTQCTVTLRILKHAVIFLVQFDLIVSIWLSDNSLIFNSRLIKFKTDRLTPCLVNLKPIFRSHVILFEIVSM